jgi:hypothetical protein
MEYRRIHIILLQALRDQGRICANVYAHEACLNEQEVSAALSLLYREGLLIREPEKLEAFRARRPGPGHAPGGMRVYYSLNDAGRREVARMFD